MFGMLLLPPPPCPPADRSPKALAYHDREWQGWQADVTRALKQMRFAAIVFGSVYLVGVPLAVTLLILALTHGATPPIAAP